MFDSNRVKGTVYITDKDKHGNIVKKTTHENTLTIAAKAQMIDALLGKGIIKKSYSHIGIGTGDVPKENERDIALHHEVYRKEITNISVENTLGRSSKIIIEAFFDIEEANFLQNGSFVNWRELGLFASDEFGRDIELFNRVTLDEPKNNTISKTISWVIELV